MKIDTKKILLVIVLLGLVYFIFNAIKIYRYSFEYSEDQSDVAIVLGSGSANGVVSSVFRERINHSIYLYNKEIVNKIIFTGGLGEGQSISDSESAKLYAIKKGIPSEDIFIEKKSEYTIENLLEAKIIMDSIGLKTALIVSDPLHMKRSIGLAKKLYIDCKSSPTQTSKYKTTLPKLKSLIYETIFYCLGQIAQTN